MTSAPHTIRNGIVSRIALILLLVAVATGCTTVRGWFGGRKGEAASKPAELTDITPTASVSRLWSAKAGKGEDRIGARQGPAIADGRVYAAAVEGGVRAFDLQTGSAVWHYESKLPLSGGPGAGDGLVVVGSLEGDVIALDAATGAEKWKAKVGEEVIAAPAVGQGMVFVHSNDGRLTAFDAASGERRWFWASDMPTLVVRGNDAPVLGPGFVFVGNDNGTVVALAVADGRELWRETVAQADGRTELDRMSDVDGTPVLADTTLYATSYKKKTVAIDAPSGRILWSADNGGAGRLGVGSDRVVVADPAGTVWALDRNSGSALWQQPALARRSLTSAVVQGDYAVVGDYDGYLHWMRLADGAFAARERMGGKSLKGSPVVADGVLVAQNVDGDIVAFRLAN